MTNRRAAAVVFAGLWIIGGVLSIAARADARQGIYVTVTALNSTGRTLRVANFSLDHGIWHFPPQTLTPPGGTVSWNAAADGILTGVEGSVDLVTDGTDEGRFHVYFDDPYIGHNSYDFSATGPFAVYRVGSADGLGDQAMNMLTIVRLKHAYPPVTVNPTGPGSITGQVRWLAAEGTPLTPGGAYWLATSISAVVPSTFEPLDPADAAPASSIYNGQQGLFSGLRPAGQLSFRPAATLPMGYLGFDYTIAGLPLSVPVQVQVTGNDAVAWSPKSSPPVGLLNATYKRAFIPLRDPGTMLVPTATVLSGMDFEVKGAWADSNGSTGNGLGAADILNQRLKMWAINPNPAVMPAVPLGSISQRFNRFRLNDTVQRGGIASQRARTQIQGLPQLQVQKGQLPQVQH